MFKSTSFASDCADPAVVAPFNPTALTISISSMRSMLTLLHTSTILAIKRRQLFEMTKSVNLTAKELTIYWNFIDNAWVQNKSPERIHVSELRCSIFWCRFQRSKILSHDREWKKQWLRFKERRRAFGRAFDRKFGRKFGRGFGRKFGIEPWRVRSIELVSMCYEACMKHTMK